MQWHILGPGAIGSLWAAGFARAGEPAPLIVAPHHSLSPTELCLCSKSVDDTAPVSYQVSRQYAAEASDHSATHHSAAAVSEPIDALLVCLKAFQVLPAIERLLPRLHSDSVVLLLHNGMGTLEPLKQCLPAGCTVLQGTTTHGAFCPSPGTVVHAGQGETRIGLAHGSLSAARQQAVVTSLQQALPAVHWQQDIERALWLKLAINCAINPLTALEQCANGGLLRSDRLATVQAVCEECSLVLNRHFAATGADDDQSGIFSSAELFNLVRSVIEQTARNYSSMHQDLSAGKPTEVEYITGYLLQQASRFDLRLPANQLLYQALRLQEA